MTMDTPLELVRFARTFGPDLSGMGGGNRHPAHHIDSPVVGATRRAAVGGQPTPPLGLDQWRGTPFRLCRSGGGLRGLR